MKGTAGDWKSFSHSFAGAGAARFRPGPSPTSPLLVLCHGMGETPGQFAGRWRRTLDLPVHAVIPAGPYPFEIRRGRDIRIGFAWYLYDGKTEWFRESLDRSAVWLIGLLRSLESDQGWRPSQRALLGFSQGAYFGYVTALANQDIFHRLVAVGGRLKREFARTALEHPGTLQTLILHGENDEAVAPEAAERSAHALQQAGYAVTRKMIPGGHALTPETDRSAADWLSRGWNPGPSPE